MFSVSSIPKNVASSSQSTPLSVCGITSYSRIAHALVSSDVMSLASNTRCAASIVAWPSKPPSQCPCAVTDNAKSRQSTKTRFGTVSKGARALADESIRWTFALLEKVRSCDTVYFIPSYGEVYRRRHVSMGEHRTHREGHAPLLPPRALVALPWGVLVLWHFRLGAPKHRGDVKRRARRWGGRRNRCDGNDSHPSLTPDPQVYGLSATFTRCFSCPSLVAPYTHGTIVWFARLRRRTCVIP